MKALLSFRAGGPDSLELRDVPDPEPKGGEVVVAVRACGVDYPDFLVIQDKYQRRPQRPFSPGTEIAGIVESIGTGVTKVRAGDCVFAAPGVGGMAEKIALHADAVTIIPPGVGFDEAAAFLFTYQTALHGLQDCAGLRAGETVLVLGAGGGVGLAAVELAKLTGACVIAAASSDARIAAAKRAGADAGLVYAAAPSPADSKILADQFKAVCGARGANVIFDTVGGNYSEPALRAIAPGGRFLVVGFPAGIAKIPLNLPLLKRCAIVGVSLGGFTRNEPAKCAENTGHLVDMLAKGLIRPYISARYPLERGGEAIAALGERRAIGKLVVTVGA